MDSKPSWSKKYDNCQNCHTNRFKHVARGYCSRCYRLIRKLEKFDRWNSSDPASIKGFPGNPYFESPDRIERIKAKLRNQTERQLFSIWAKEEKLNNFVNGTDIEKLLGRIANQCRINVIRYMDPGSSAPGISCHQIVIWRI